MAKVVFLGVAGDQTPEHETVSFLVVSDKKKILVDVGPGIVRQLLRAGYKASEIDAVVITHCHGDHTLGFPYLMFRNFIDRTMGLSGPQSVSLIALREVREGLLDMMAFCYPPGKFPMFEIKEVELEDFVSVRLDDVSVITAPVTHMVPNIGVRVELPGAKIAYSSDTVYDDNVVKLAEGCDLLIHEALATSEMREMAHSIKHGLAEEAGQVAEEAGVKALALVHMLESYIGREQSLIDEAAKYFGGEIFVPEELSEFLL